jgi:hypothetical protein
MDLPLARQTLARAQRMLDDLSRREDDEVAFQDRLPYVLDLLAGVTRCINDESRGHKTAKFCDWWNTVDRTMQKAIHELRNAELKRAESRAEAEVKLEFDPPHLKSIRTGVRMDVEELTANQFSIIVSTQWRFIGGDLDGKSVLPALAQYWNEVSRVLATAEELLQR